MTYTYEIYNSDLIFLSFSYGDRINYASVFLNTHTSIRLVDKILQHRPSSNTGSVNRSIDTIKKMVKLEKTYDKRVV